MVCSKAARVGLSAASRAMPTSPFASPFASPLASPFAVFCDTAPVFGGSRRSEARIDNSRLNEYNGHFKWSIHTGLEHRVFYEDGWQSSISAPR